LRCPVPAASRGGGELRSQKGAKSSLPLAGGTCWRRRGVARGPGARGPEVGSDDAGEQVIRAPVALAFTNARKIFTFSLGEVFPLAARFLFFRPIKVIFRGVNTPRVIFWKSGYQTAGNTPEIPRGSTRRLIDNTLVESKFREGDALCRDGFIIVKRSQLLYLVKGKLSLTRMRLQGRKKDSRLDIYSTYLLILLIITWIKLFKIY
jgi:hypothetical protein